MVIGAEDIASDDAVHVGTFQRFDERGWVCPAGPFKSVRKKIDGIYVYALVYPGSVPFGVGSMPRRRSWNQ